MVANKNNPLWPFAIHSQRKSNFQSMRRHKWYDMNVYENNRKNCKQAISTSKDAIIFLSILIRFHLVKYRLICQNLLINARNCFCFASNIIQEDKSSLDSYTFPDQTKWKRTKLRKKYTQNYSKFGVQFWGKRHSVSVKS